VRRARAEEGEKKGQGVEEIEAGQQEKQ